MKTIENLNITSLTLRDWNDLYGSGRNYTKRLGFPIEDDFNNRLKKIAEDIGIRPTEIIRQAIEAILIECKGYINENDLESQY